MNPSVTLCPHLASLELAELPILPADILEWRDGPVVAVARCARCERLGLLELVEGDRRAGVRSYTLAGLDPEAFATYQRDLARGSCDPTRLAKEGEAFLAAAGPVERVVSLAVRDGALLRVERSSGRSAQP
ncbi:MAG TPA: hypothetical protein VMR31_03835 [Myxococcota bacterium]|nr:hypothetical protein [Myxococcota bacterium]